MVMPFIHLRVCLVKERASRFREKFSKSLFGPNFDDIPGSKKSQRDENVLCRMAVLWLVLCIRLKKESARKVRESIDGG